MRQYFLLLFILLCHCTRTETIWEFDGVLFGSYVKIKVSESDQAIAKRAVDKAFAEMKRLDSIFSKYLPESEINRINQQGKGKLSKDLKELLVKSVEVSEKSNGAFDITISPLTQIWRDYSKQGKIPDSLEIKQQMKFVDYRKIKIQNDSVYLPSGFTIDLGGIAVGYCVDRAVAVLLKEGIKTGLIDAGGDIMGFGNRKWKVAVKNPRGDGMIKTFSIQNQAIATSGDYEKFFMKNGKRYHHILDPKTGYPAWGCCSVTVIALDAVTVDAFSTAILVLGVRDGLALAEKEEGVEAFIIAEEEGTLIQYQTSGIK